MTSLENNGQDMDLTELEVMEPKMMIHDELKVIYINEALEEALNDENSNEKKKYDAEKAAHPDYVTRLRRLPVTIEFMKKYAALKKDSFMQDLIERKEPALRAKANYMKCLHSSPSRIYSLQDIRNAGISTRLRKRLKNLRSVRGIKNRCFDLIRGLRI